MVVLLPLAERVSSLTEVTAEIKFDKNYYVDYSNITLVNDFFKLTSATLDEETNTLTLTLNWIKQSKSVDPETANPTLILSGMNLILRDDAEWNAKNKLEIAHTGTISYKVCLRASALVSFAAKPENQQYYGLYPYSNPDDEKDKGAYFSSVYHQITDKYELDKSVKNLSRIAKRDDHALACDFSYDKSGFDFHFSSPVFFSPFMPV